MGDPLDLVCLAAVGPMRADDFGLRHVLLEESQIKLAIDHHPRAARENFNLLEPEKILVKVAELRRFRGNKSDVSQFAHGHDLRLRLRIIYFLAGPTVKISAPSLGRAAMIFT